MNENRSAVHRVPVEFGPVGDMIRGTLHLPDTAGRVPVVVAAHGWAMTADGDLQDYAAQIAARGIGVLTFDFRRLGRSDGTPRQDLDPWAQVEDYRRAISYVRDRAEFDRNRIGVWGSSYSGGHVLVVAAIDPRVSCVVSQVPMINGWAAGVIRSTPAALRDLNDRFIADHENVTRGGELDVIQTVASDDVPVAYAGPDSYSYMTDEGRRSQTWRNFTTLRSIERARAYNPGSYIERIAPKPLLMIVASGDEIGPTRLQQDAYQRALDPKQLLLVPGGHYAVYEDQFRTCATAAADWFQRHLASSADDREQSGERD
jgi:uncharacterized protein